ncbi:GAF domain-containing protein [Nostoc sp.]|uniref:GAF domain-containing protein n=1 Tax=Nostoc sp. TaxID=1180 RepID=UPI002FF57622
MMIALPGFQIVTLLKAGVKAVIYRGIKVKDQCPVIIKELRPEQCTPNNIEQFKHEYAIAQRLNIAAALIVYALEMHQGIPYLIMEDFQARSLEEIYAQYDFNAWISIPLMVEGWAVGGISLGFTQPQQLSGEDQAFILAVAQQCAQAIAVGFQQHISKPVDPEELVKAIASLTI